VFVCVSPIAARERLRKNSPIVSRQRLGKHVSTATNTQEIIGDLLDAPFSMRTVSYQGKYVISSSQNSLSSSFADGLHGEK
jgi:hypothetical protein